MADVLRMPPRGRYMAWEAGQLAGVSGLTIGQWARRGYIRSSVERSIPRIYGFQDIAEAMVVHELLDRGVTHRDIKKAILELGDRYGDWPLTDADLATAPGKTGAKVIARESEGAYDIGHLGWQQVIEPENLEKIRSQLRRGGWAVRTIPDLEHIEVDPDRLSGRPTIRGRRLAAEEVAEIASGKGGVEILRGDYELNEAEIADARRWWREVRRLEAVAA